VPKHVGTALVINTLTKPSAQCWFYMHNQAMHGTNIKKKKNPRPTFLPQCVPVSSTPTQTNKQNYIYVYLNPLTPELNPSAQPRLTRFLMGILLLEQCVSLTYA
jgi:hypothetical protein